MKKRLSKMLSLFVCGVLLSGVFMPLSAAAQRADKKTVRVGWYESAYCYRDKFGRRCGIAYEYQHRIAAHTGWEYEYVEDSWPNLLQMLKDGEIDLLSDVSYTEERAENMLFPASPMGEESYYMYMDADNNEISADDPSTINGKRIGVNKGSYQHKLLESWLKKNGIECQIVEMTEDESAFIDMVTKGELDAIVTMDSFGSRDRVVPVSKIGSSDYYFAVNKDRPDLLAELNSAMSSIQDEDPYFNQRLFDEYIHLTKTNAFLNQNQEKWLTSHGAIRVGYREDYLPFCATDSKTGELTGALKDYLAFADHSLKNADISFEPVPYKTANDAIDALKKGEVDCVFPISLSSYDSEQMGIITVSPIMQTEMYAIVRGDQKTDITSGQSLTVAVNKGNLNHDTFLKEAYPEWKTKVYDSAEECFSAVASKSADLTLISNYRINRLDDIEKKYELVSLPTGEVMKFSFALRSEDRELYSILNKISNLTDSKAMESALISYAYADKNTTLTQILKDNWLIVILVVSAVFGLIIFLLWQKLRAERRMNYQQMKMREQLEKMNEQKKQMEEGLKREHDQQAQIRSVTLKAYTDPLTGVKSKHAYLETEQRMDRMIENGELDRFAIIMFDVNDLKKVNDTQGHDEGDKLIKEVCRLICNTFKHSPVFRIGGDEFAAVLENAEYDNRAELLGGFDRQIDKNAQSGGITVASGCAEYDSSIDSGAHSVLERADEKMYTRKKELKKNTSSGRA